MRHPIFTLLLCGITVASSPLLAQDFSAIDARARRVPVPSDLNIPKLAARLSEGCKTQAEKARSIFVWVTENVRYDTKTKQDRAKIPDEKWIQLQAPTQVIKRKKAVCEGYTNLFGALCHSAGIQVLEVGGVTKRLSGTISQSGHAWNLIYVDGKWAFVDATWGAGGVDDGDFHKQFDDRFFLMTTDALLEDHYPNDPLLQCLPNPLTMEEFSQPKTKLPETLKRKRAGNAAPGFENITDSLSAAIAQDSNLYLFASGQRSLRVNPRSSYGPWAVGKFYYRSAMVEQDKYFDAIDNLQSVDYFPSIPWFDAQVPVLKKWEAQAEKCLAAVKNPTVQDSYSPDLQALRQSAQSTLKHAQGTLKDISDMKASVKRGVRVKLTSSRE